MEDSPTAQAIFGPMLLGAFLNVVLYGIMLMQVLIYYQTHNNYGARDSRWIKSLISYLVVVGTVNTSFVIAMVYEPLITRYDSDSALIFFPKMLASEPIMTTAVSSPIQIFFAWRIWKFSESLWIPCIVCLLASSSFAGGTWTTIDAAFVRRYINKATLHGPSLLWLMSTAVADAIITISLFISLYRRRTGQGKRVDEVVNRIMTLTIQTGITTSLIAITDVICFFFAPRTTINFVWDFALNKLYINFLLSTLNARTEWNEYIFKQNEIALNELAIPAEASTLDLPATKQTLDHPSRTSSRTVMQEPSTS
ncbi:hypothetical protein AX17_005666 [Amanita inopinata Kibby_2008]|nr:hypothetical protein AX17_005666 [Amanita inopinata Kibby_2008]